ncbi:MAG: AAA family ATPase [Gammaproteobacteria bacterium]
MVENDIFTSEVPQNSLVQAKSAVNSLITSERSQKLDLLAHLITNLKQSLIVTGPLGIGKTTLLKALIERASPDWQCCYIQGEHSLSFEAILEQLERFIKQDTADFKAQNLTGLLTLLNQRNQKLILLVDEAGLLVPGLIDALNRYALANPVLRIIFALTQDELYVKSRSDRTVEDCHFIELPPLSEKQCGEFLWNLSGKPGAPVSFGAINDAMISHLYQETHGIPGRIMKELPHLSEFGQTQAVKWTPWILPVLVVVAGLIYWHYDENGSFPSAAIAPKTNVRPVITSVEPVPPKFQPNDRPSIRTESGIETKESLIDAEVLVNDNAGPMTDNNKQSPGKAVPGVVNEDEARLVQATSPGQDATAVAPVPVPAEPAQKHDKAGPDSEKKPVTESNAASGSEPSAVLAVPSSSLNSAVQSESEQKKPVFENDDKPWLFGQPSTKYTLQLIALSKRQSLMALMNKYGSMKAQFKFIRQVSGKKEKYILLYGSFDSYASAGSAMKTLPKEFSNAWIRRFKVLQNDVKNGDAMP